MVGDFGAGLLLFGFEQDFLHGPRTSSSPING
jgi:hypothetical protein